MEGLGHLLADDADHGPLGLVVLEHRLRVQVELRELDEHVERVQVDEHVVVVDGRHVDVALLAAVVDEVHRVQLAAVAVVVHGPVHHRAGVVRRLRVAGPRARVERHVRAERLLDVLLGQLQRLVEERERLVVVGDVRLHHVRVEDERIAVQVVVVLGERRVHGLDFGRQVGDDVALVLGQLALLVLARRLAHERLLLPIQNE